MTLEKGADMETLPKLSRMEAVTKVFSLQERVTRVSEVFSMQERVTRVLRVKTIPK